MKTELCAALIAFLGVLFIFLSCNVPQTFSLLLIVSASRLCQVLYQSDIAILLFPCLFMLRPVENLVISFCISTGEIPPGLYDNLHVSISLLVKQVQMGSYSILLRLKEEVLALMRKWVTEFCLFLIFYCTSYIPHKDIKLERNFFFLFLAILCHIGSFFLKH